MVTANWCDCDVAFGIWTGGLETVGPGSYDAVAIARAAAFRMLVVSRIRHAAICQTTMPERMVETRAELPFIGDQVVCLSHRPGPDMIRLWPRQPLIACGMRPASGCLSDLAARGPEGTRPNQLIPILESRPAGLRPITRMEVSCHRAAATCAKTQSATFVPCSRDASSAKRKWMPW